MIEVSLDSDQKPVFSSRCVVCGSGNTRGRALFTAQSDSSRATIWREVPCCISCATTIHVRRLGRATGRILAAGLPFVVYIVATNRAMHKVPAIAISVGALFILMPLWLRFEGRIQPVFDLTYDGNSVTYRFRNETMGLEFRSLNPPIERPVPRAGGRESPWRFMVSDDLPLNMKIPPPFKEVARSQATRGLPPVVLLDKETRQMVGKITATEFRFLTLHLQAESLPDRDFYIDEGTIAMLEEAGSPDPFARILRSGLRGRDGYEVTW